MMKNIFSRNNFDINVFFRVFFKIIENIFSRNACFCAIVKYVFLIDIEFCEIVENVFSKGPFDICLYFLIW